jgi:hypothetical protein
MNPETLRALHEADARLWAAWRARASAADRDAYDQVLALVGPQGRSGTLDITRRFLIDVSWEAHAVRHALGAHDAVRWFVAVLALEPQGAVSVSVLARPADDATWHAWQDRPLGEWGVRHITPPGVLALAAAYGRISGAPQPAPFFCEECVCACGAPSAVPGGGWCAACRAAYAADQGA